jgi:exopolysaccharide production protein ExoY
MGLKSNTAFPAELRTVGTNAVLPAPVTPLMERCTSGVALLAVSPVLVSVMAVVRILSRKSPLVAIERVGLNGEPLWVLKIRTMWERSEWGSGWVEYLNDPDVPFDKNGDDPRVTSRFAAMCRRFSIDEWPQLLHVMQGKMRLAGPRPLTREELDTFYGDHAREVLSVLPGITGLWQVMGRNRLTYRQRLRLDRMFVRRKNWKLYAWVLLRTPGAVLRGSGAK